MTCSVLFYHCSAGSGKTLSFGIPMIHSILEWKKSIESKKAGADRKSDSVADVQSIYLPSVRDSKGKSGEAEGQRSNKTGGTLTDKEATSTDKASSSQNDNTDNEHEEENPTEDEGSVEGQDEADDCGSADGHQSQDDDDDKEGANQSMSFITEKEEKHDGKQPLLGLVLTPTRELAVQVKHHIDAVAQFTGL